MVRYRSIRKMRKRTYQRMPELYRLSFPIQAHNDIKPLLYWNCLELCSNCMDYTYASVCRCLHSWYLLWKFKLELNLKCSDQLITARCYQST